MPGAGRGGGGKLIQHAQAEFHIGPLPRAEDLARYDAVLPGLADRIVTMAENQMAHRIRIEEKVITGNVASQGRGQWFGFMLGMSVVWTGFWLVSHDKVSYGLWTVFGGIVTLAGTFLGVRWIQKKERAEKAAAVPAH